jgi:hypothetical protein
MNCPSLGFSFAAPRQDSPGQANCLTTFSIIGYFRRCNERAAEEQERLLIQNPSRTRIASSAGVAEGRIVGAMIAKNYPGVTGFGMHFFNACRGLGRRGWDFRDPAAVRDWAESIRPLLIR